MTTPLKALEERALALVMKGHYGPEAPQVNRAIIELAPESPRRGALSYLFSTV